MTTALVLVRRDSIVSTTDCQVSARSKPLRPDDGIVGHRHALDPADAERAHAVVGVGDQVPHRPLLDETERVHGALRLAAGAVGVGQPHLDAVDDRPLQHVQVGRTGCAEVPPQPAGSSTIADAAASASARNVSGNACTSLRRAAFASGVAVDDGPAIMNSVRASAAVSPERSVRAPPSSVHPPPLPGCEYTGMPAMARASRSRRAVLTDTSNSSASSAAVMRPLAWSTSSVATRRSARM